LLLFPAKKKKKKKKKKRILLCIPQEVLLDVASHLDIHDKLNLMTTCSMLNSLILDRSLYQVLSFYGEKEPTEQVVSKFKSNQYNGHQVKRLELKLDCLSDSVFSQLPDIFPNVTRIFDYSDNTSESKRNATTLDSLLKWKDTIEYSGTSEDRFKVARLLAKVEFSRLTELDITFSYFEYNDNCLYGTESVIHISAFVKNAPLLKRLRLYGCAMDLNLLEGIHQSCPNLFFLALEGYLNVNSLSIPVIEPANNLLHLSLGWELMICDQQCLFLDYIVDKYPNLNHLLFFPTFAKYMVTFVLHKFYSDEFNGIYRWSNYYV
jgi:hypothetical protein